MKRVYIYIIYIYIFIHISLYIPTDTMSAEDSQKMITQSLLVDVVHEYVYNFTSELIG